MIGLIIGLGEVGRALKNVLKAHHDIYAKDLAPISQIPKPNVMHVCLRYDKNFNKTVSEYAEYYQPDYIDICTTVPPGTTAKFGLNAVHSTTRGLHPNLEKSLKTFTKHVSGPEAERVADYYRMAGIRCKVNMRPETTELAHILSNAVYGINLLFADEMARLCRHYGVDYTQAVLAYNETSNQGYEALDHKSKLRMLLTPPQGKIGGHCVKQGAGLIPFQVRTDCQTPLLEMLVND